MYQSYNYYFLLKLKSETLVITMFYSGKIVQFSLKFDLELTLFHNLPYY